MAEIVNFEEVGINQGPYVQLVPTFALSTEIKAAEFGEISPFSENMSGGHCGAVS